MKVTIVKPTQKCGTILCQHDSGRWYFVSLIVDGEILEERRYCLGYMGYCSSTMVGKDILDAVKLSDDVYSVYQPLHYDLWVMVRREEDFSVELWEDSITK